MVKFDLVEPVKKSTYFKMLNCGDGFLMVLTKNIMSAIS